MSEIIIDRAHSDMMRSVAVQRFDVKELIPALFFLAVGLFFLLNSIFVVGLDESAAGSAIFAAVVSVLLIGIAVSLLIKSFLTRGERLTFVGLRPLAAILAAPVVFGLTVRPLGFLPAIVMSLICASFADSTTPIGRRAIPLLLITVLCIAVFHYGLRLPFALIAGLNLH
ncbi:MAG: hypothetical protein IBJ15_00440 [Alphaproteobacteria bacterium]|nr:hypothetical protein [Alphaproteobacteria bacterium]